MKNQNESIGLFFGSFNPIHIAHLIIAQYIKQLYNLNKIWFIVSPQSPHKSDKSLISQFQRYYMVNIAVEDTHYFHASDIEFKLPKPSYTINTINKLKEIYPDKKFSILMGQDNINSINTWKNYIDIVNNYTIYVFPRNNPTNKTLQINSPNIILTPTPLIDISSSLIRNLIKKNIDVSYMLHPKVYKYIQEMNLYK